MDIAPATQRSLRWRNAAGRALILDEAHATRVQGPTGRGMAVSKTESRNILRCRRPLRESSRERQRVCLWNSLE